MKQRLARAAYEGYRNHTGGKSLVSGAPIPEWEDLPEAIRSAWMASIVAIRETLATGQSRVIASLLSQYQDFLEEAIHSELIPSDEGFREPTEPEVCRRLKRDRRRWRACEDFQRLLSPGGPSDVSA